MPTIVGVRFRPSDRVHYLDAAGLRVSAGDRALVETGDGRSEGIAAIGSGQVVHSDLRGPLLRVIRVLSRGRDRDAGVS